MFALQILYSFILIILSPFAFVIGYIISYRRGDTVGYAERFGFIKLTNPIRSNSIWFHAASVGEVRSIAYLIEEIRKIYPQTDIVISTMTTTGRDVAKNIIKAEHAFLLPIENSSAIKNIIKLLHTKYFFIVDTEIWLNLIKTASENSTLILLNGRISDKTFDTYKRFKFIIKRILKSFAAILVKSSDDADRFAYLLDSDTKIATIGNIKFQKRRSVKDIKLIDDFKDINYVLAASTHTGEEDLILRSYKNSKPIYDKLIIAPRHINRSQDIKKIAENYGFKTALFSDNHNDADVIIVDKFGMLESLYVTATKIFIGGSVVNVGGHNIYEALQFEKQIATGVYMQNFNEIKNMADKYKLITCCTVEDDLKNWLNKKDKKVSFTKFFKAIDDENSAVINKILELIK